MKVKLSTINEILTKFGIVLVVSFDEDTSDNVCFWIETCKSYNKRVEQGNI